MSFTTPVWDLQLFRLFNDELRGPFLDYAMPLLSYTPIVWGIAMAAIGIFLYRNHRDWRRLLWLVLVLGISVGVTDMACNVIKHEVERPRPHQALAGVHYLSNAGWRETPPMVEAKEHTSRTSFVSSHAANSMALIVGLLFLFSPSGRFGQSGAFGQSGPSSQSPQSHLFRRAKPWLLTLPLLVGWSRLYLGKHYPTDVLGGYAVGALVGVAVWYALKAVRWRWERG